VSEFRIDAAGSGRFAAHGVLTFDTAAVALPYGLALMEGASDIEIDLKDVSAGDSAGLAVLIEWLAAARARGARLRYAAIPAQIMAVARISDLDELLTV
jgi:phospholipid transport system transporter-binding protein